MVDFAISKGFDYYQDEHNNVIIWAPASEGFEDSEPLALQTHMDMVCVSTDKEKDPAIVGVSPLTDGTWIYTDGTSLGADDGIGLAIVLSILEDKTLMHPPIEAIFTIDEEIGLRGAQLLDLDVLQSKRMLNIDNETENFCIISSASGRRIHSIIPVSFEEITNYSTFKIEVDGLLGGHSGIMINLGRANASIILARLLLSTIDVVDFRIADYLGGTAHNVIPSQSSVTVVINKADEDKFLKLINESMNSLKQEYSETDAGMHFSITKAQASKAMTASDSKNIIKVLCEIPDGLIIANDLDNSPLVSLNSGIVKLEANNLYIKTFMRSNISTEIEPLFDSFTNVITEHNGTYEIESDYSAWDYDPDSLLVKQILKSYKAVTGKEALTHSVHGGLEGSMFSNIDMASIGPEIKDVHSINEKVSVQSVNNLYEVVVDVLKNSK